MKESTRKEYLAGIKAAVPVILGFVPVGIAYAIMARQAGFSVLETCLMSLTVFAGASQMMAVGMVSAGSGIIAIIIATFILNLRHLIMSTCCFEIMKDDKSKLKPLAAYGVTDESFAIFTTDKKAGKTAVFFLGMVTVTYSSWNIGTLIGAVASDFLPPIITASLGVALYAMFIGLLVPNMTGNWKLALLVCGTALFNLLLNQFISPSWALITATLLGALVGVFFVDLDEKKEDTKE